MYTVYLAFEWLARHPLWTMLGVFVLGGTMAIVWAADRHR